MSFLSVEELRTALTPGRDGKEYGNFRAVIIMSQVRPKKSGGGYEFAIVAEIQGERFPGKSLWWSGDLNEHAIKTLEKLAKWNLYKGTFRDLNKLSLVGEEVNACAVLNEYPEDSGKFSVRVISLKQNAKVPDDEWERVCAGKESTPISAGASGAESEGSGPDEPSTNDDLPF